MPPLLLLLHLAVASADEPSASVHRIGDLAVEGELARMGVPREDASQVTTRWLLPIPAPERARREGRTEGWEFGVARVWISERALVGSDHAHERELIPRWNAPIPCAVLPGQAGAPWSPTPVAPPVRRPGVERDTEPPMKIDLTVAERPEERIVLVPLVPGESATSVEVIPPDDRAPRRLARTRRRLSLNGHRLDLDLHEGDVGRRVCVDVHPPSGDVQVFVGRNELRETVHEIMERRREGGDALAEGE